MLDPEQNQAYWLSKSESEHRSLTLSNISYTLSLTLSPSSFSGTCQISFTSLTSSTWLDLNGATITSLLLNSSPVDYSYFKSRVNLPSLVPGDNTLSISYSRNYSKDGYGLHCFTEPTGEVYIYSNFEPFHAHKMFPCFDQPDLKATYTLQVQCPSHWKVISNDLATNVSEESDCSTHFFPTTLKFSTYLFALVAGDYYEHRYEHARFPLGIYCRKALVSELDPARYLKWTLRGFEFYERMFGISYPFRKYDQVFVPEYNAGAMENVGCVTYKEDYLKLQQSKTQLNLAAFTFLHEMSHMWFGNLVTMKWWNDLWLNESFATYLSYLAVDCCLNDDFQQSWILFLRRKTFAYVADQKKTTHPISCNIENTSQTRGIFDSISYSKGAAVIKQIVFMMGFEDFSSAVKEYLQTFQFRNTDSEDFIDMLSKKKSEIREWSHDWLRTFGVNFVYCEIGDGFVRLKQTAEGNCEKIKHHEFVCEVYSGQCEVVLREKVKMTSEFVELQIETPAACVLVNVEDHDYVKVVIDAKSLEFVKTNMHLFQDPLTRMLLVTQLLEMVNSLLLPTSEFLQILYTQFCYETEEIIANYILTTTSSTLITKVSDESTKNQFYLLFFSKILEKLDLSLDFHDTIFSFIYTDEQVAQAVQWLEGSSPVPLTQSRRWRLLKQYARLNIDAKKLVDCEIDPSHEGKLARLYCEAVYPDAEVKAKAWQRFLEGCPELSRFERKSLMSGFLKKSQRNILKPYSQLFFDEIPNIKQRFNFEYLLDFCSLLFPEYKKLQFLKENVETTLKVIGEDNKQIVKVFADKLESIERNRRIKGTL